MITDSKCCALSFPWSKCCGCRCACVFARHGILTLCQRIQALKKDIHAPTALHTYLFLDCQRSFCQLKLELTVDQEVPMRRFDWTNDRDTDLPCALIVGLRSTCSFSLRRCCLYSQRNGSFKALCLAFGLTLSKCS